MRDQFDMIINKYLTTEIPYAILIDGTWGSGKTWYFKNKFENDFHKKVVYTTANGLTSIDDLTDQILFRKLYSSKLMTNTTGKVAFSLVTGVGKSFLNKVTGFNLDDKKNKANIYDLATIAEDEVLIIDDIERMSTVLFDTLLGYISKNFTEESGIKVILIADEDKLREKKELVGSNYLEIKEKTIWQTLEFQLDYGEVIPLITSLKCDSILPRYPLFNEDVISFLRAQNLANLRTVLYAYDCINDIANSVIDRGSLPILVNSILVLSNEYKNGFITSRIEDDVPEFLKLSINTMIWSMSNENNEMTPDQIHIDRFSQKYLNNSTIKYYYFESLYHLVCHGFLDMNLLEVELEELQKSFDTPNPAMEALGKFYGYRNLSDKVFSDIVSQVLQFLKFGAYDVYTVWNIIKNFKHYFDYGLLNLTISEFEINLEEYISNIDLNISNSEFIDPFIKVEYFTYLSEGEKYYDLLKEKIRLHELIFLNEEKILFIDALKKGLEVTNPFYFEFIKLNDNELEDLAKYYKNNSLKLNLFYQYCVREKSDIANLSTGKKETFIRFIKLLRLELVDKKIPLSIVNEIESLIL